jgi:hypothetical protein
MMGISHIVIVEALSLLLLLLLFPVFFLFSSSIGYSIIPIVIVISRITQRLFARPITECPELGVIFPQDDRGVAVH